MLYFRELCRAGGGAIDACEMTRALLRGEDAVGYCCVRPSGHHAEPDRAMGFCLFDNVAVAAAMAIEDLGLKRVMVLDWDVHHGNGTAEIFRRRDDVLFFSIHQSPLYPGSGAATDLGSGPGEGYTVNLPVPPGSGEEIWLSLVEHIVVPIAESFGPELILISAGFDGHREDLLAGCNLEASSFAQMTCHVRDLARRLGVPLGAVQEGGYHLGSLVESLLATMAALGGEGKARGAAAAEALTPRAAATVAPYWPL
ncbi:MAG: histone deacetylase [Thermoleophilia bacterium]|nr:histone deacetylase [Thermoleophilia bacterium]